jgi:hypothetical protein
LWRTIPAAQLAKKLLPASCLYKHPDAATPRRMQRFPKAAAFGAFSWFVLCRVAKNEHQKTNRSARDKVAQYERP